MLSEAHRKRLILERCWLIYDLITTAFETPDLFHADFPQIAEAALVWFYLRLSVNIHCAGYTLDIHEEYSFEGYELVVESYSYNLIDAGGNWIIRADRSPHYRKDHKNKELVCFPHHLHDEKGRIVSFSGEIEAFIAAVKAFLSRQL